MTARIRLDEPVSSPNLPPDFGDGQRGNKQILVDLFSHPGQQRFRRRRLCNVADNVGVEEITAHSSTLRPGSNRRTGAISAPTSGERRSASRMPPFLGGSPEIAWLTTALRRAWRSSDAWTAFSSVPASSTPAPRSVDRMIFLKASTAVYWTGVGHGSGRK